MTYDAKPHVGTDVLTGVVKSIREEIISLGGEVRFGAKLAGLVFDESGAVKGARVVSGGVEYVQECSALVLATGHSARDTFEMLLAVGVPMEAKAFSMGARIEHLQSELDLAQYGVPRGKILPAADYSLSVPPARWPRCVHLLHVPGRRGHSCCERERRRGDERHELFGPRHAELEQRAASPR